MKDGYQSRTSTSKRRDNHQIIKRLRFLNFSLACAVYCSWTMNRIFVQNQHNTLVNLFYRPSKQYHCYRTAIPPTTQNFEDYLYFYFSTILVPTYIPTCVKLPNVSTLASTQLTKKTFVVPMESNTLEF